MNKGNWLNLKVGDSVRIGLECSKVCGLPPYGVIDLIEGSFDYDNGLYTETQTAPSIYDLANKEFSSIFHLFGNDLEDFLDSDVIKAQDGE